MSYTILDVKDITGGVAAPVFSVDPIAGDSIIVFSGRQGAAGSAPTDTAGNTYVQIGTTQSVPSWSLSLIIWAALNITHTASAGTFAVTPNSGTFSASCIWLISGNLSYNGDMTFIDAQIAASGTILGVNIATPPSSSIVFGFVAFAPSASTLTDSAGWNTTGSNGFTGGMLTNTKLGSFASSCLIATQYKISVAAEQASWTLTTGDRCGAITLSFTNSVPPPSTTGNMLDAF